MLNKTDLKAIENLFDRKFDEKFDSKFDKAFDRKIKPIEKNLIKYKKLWIQL